MVELSKTEAMKSKLEGLCRELRRQNQEIAEEEKRKRNDITQQFNNTIRQMESKLDQQNQSRNDKKKEYETYAREGEQAGVSAVAHQSMI